MRSDAAPAIQKASSSQFGIVKVDGTTITESGGVISAVGGGGGLGYAYAVSPNSSISSSAFATKGRTITPFITLTALTFFPVLTEVVGASYRLTVCTLSGNTLDTVIGTSDWIGTSAVTKMVEVPLNVTLTGGQAYGILITRTDGASTYVLPLSGSSTITSSPWGGLPSQFNIQSLTSATTNPSPGTVFNIGTAPFSGNFLFSI
jgi:hypothetical protein